MTTALVLWLIAALGQRKIPCGQAHMTNTLGIQQIEIMFKGKACLHDQQQCINQNVYPSPGCSQKSEIYMASNAYKNVTLKAQEKYFEKNTTHIHTYTHKRILDIHH